MNDRYGGNTVYNIEYHFVWVTKYRYQVLMLPLCDYCYLLDNSRLDDPFQQIAKIGHGQIILKKEPLPEWAEIVLLDYLN